MESVGAKLKKIRLEKGLSLEEAHKKTKIHLNVLKAIEGDTLTNLNPVYLKGFLKIYCRFLGVDPKDYISDYKETQSGIKDINLEKPPSFFRTASIKLSSMRQNKEVKLAFIYILAFVLVSFALFRIGKFLSSRHKAHLAQTTKSIPVIPAKPEKKKMQKAQTAKNLSVVSSLQVTQAASKKEAMPEIRLVILAKENCWISLKADGRAVFQRVLEKGRSETWKAKDKMELTLSNAAGVELQVNGERFPSLGRRGQVLKNIVITAKEGLKIPR
jgi:cytoskeletal protein RodZ